MLTENYVKAGNVMENKYSRLQISIHWLVFCWLSQRIAQWSFGVSSHVAIGHHQHDSCFLRHINSRADGRSSFVKAEIPNPADYT